MEKEKQTCYDKNLGYAWKEYQKSCGIFIDSLPDKEFSSAFRKGYEYCVGQQMEQTRKEAKENEDAFVSASDSISQNVAIRDVCSDKSLMRAEFAKAAMAAIIPTTSPKNYQTVAQVAVNFADALIAELEKPREPCR